MQGQCGICGCTQDDACIDFETGCGCHWVRPDLCSQCVGMQLPETLEQWGLLGSSASLTMELLAAQMYGFMCQSIPLDAGRAMRLLELSRGKIQELTGKGAHDARHQGH